MNEDAFIDKGTEGCIGQTKTKVDGHHKENHVDAPPKHSIIVS
jgi:hypothetical protein